MYKQIIIARKDLNMSAGKLSGQVGHASMSFLTDIIKKNTNKYWINVYHAWENYHLKKPQYYRRDDLNRWAEEARKRGDVYFFCKPVNPKEPYGKLELCDPTYKYEVKFNIDIGIFEEWINGSFTKIVLEAKNKNHLLKAKTMAENIGMIEGKDFFLIRDNCHTELEPEEFDENGVGRCLTCIGFAPMDEKVIDIISKKYQLYK